MPSLFRKLLLFSLAVLLLHEFHQPLFAQEQRAPSVSSLRQLTRKSGYIFAGTVTNVQRVGPAAANDVATVRITFRVERAILGVRAGQTLVIREWAGLWDSGERYRTGERLLLFLYRPSKLGLTSPVAGALGRFRMDRNGEVVLERTRMETLWSDPGIDMPLRGRTRVNGREFARAIQRAAQE
jgi:hypothetical protein